MVQRKVSEPFKKLRGLRGLSRVERSDCVIPVELPAQEATSTLLNITQQANHRLAAQLNMVLLYKFLPLLQVKQACQQEYQYGGKQYYPVIPYYV